jgi:hypothetical protein
VRIKSPTFAWWISCSTSSRDLTSMSPWETAASSWQQPRGQYLSLPTREEAPRGKVTRANHCHSLIETPELPHLVSGGRATQLQQRPRFLLATWGEITFHRIPQVGENYYLWVPSQSSHKHTNICWHDVMTHADSIQLHTLLDVTKEWFMFVGMTTVHR